MAHISPFAGTQILPLLAVGTPQHIPASIAPSRVVPVQSHSPTSPPPAALLADNNNKSTSGEAGYSDRLRSSTRPNLDYRETGTARSRSSDSRRWGTFGGGFCGRARGRATRPPPGLITSHWNDLPVRAEKEADQPPPESGASRRQLSPAPGKRHQLASPRPTGHHRRHLGSTRSTECHPQSYLPGLGRPCRPLGRGICAHGPSGRSRTPTRRYSGLKHANVVSMTMLSRRRTLRGRGPWQ